MKRGVAIEEYLQPLQPNQTQCYLTNTLQVADIVEWVLSQIGKSTIWQTSFSISEEFLRRLYFISKSGNVETIHLLLDFKATQKTLRLWAFLTQVIEHTYLADNHSKVILIQSAAMSVAIITSQNLTLLHRMRECHLQARKIALADKPCADCDIYPFVKELIELDKRLHSNWQTYDEYGRE